MTWTEQLVQAVHIILVNTCPAHQCMLRPHPLPGYDLSWLDWIYIDDSGPGEFFLGHGSSGGNGWFWVIQAYLKPAHSAMQHSTNSFFKIPLSTCYRPRDVLGALGLEGSSGKNAHMKLSQETRFSSFRDQFLLNFLRFCAVKKALVNSWIL